MTNIKFYKSNDMFFKIECLGHTNYNEYGSDILCASISSILQSAIIGLQKVVKIDNLLYRIDDKKAYLEIELPKKIGNDKLHDSQIIFNTVYLSILDLSVGYSKNILMEVINDVY